MKKKLRAILEEQKFISQHIGEYDRIDLKILLTVIVLCGFGVVMIYSASSYRCSITEKFNFDSFYFAKKQLMISCAGILGAALVGTFMDYNKIRSYTKLFYLVGVASIFLLLTPLGVSVNNAVRWIKIGITIQVAEVVKIVLIGFLAGLSYKYAFRMRKLKTLLMFWFVGGIPAAFILFISNDLSSALILLGITFGVTYVVTAWKKLHLSIVFGVFVGAFGLVNYLATNMPSPEELTEKSFRLGRIAAWLNPELYADGVGYQPLQALYAVASGGFTGKGLGNGIQKLSSIPEAQNDMIFAVICEELGIIGAFLTIYLLGYLIYLLFRIAISCTDLFGSTLVMGVMLHIVLQASINIAVVIGLIPNTGASLPFISYGGTAILFTLFEIGISLSVYRQYVKSQIMKKYAASEEKKDSYGTRRTRKAMVRNQ